MGSRWSTILLIGLAACGRIGFDDQAPINVEQARGMLSVGSDHACTEHGGQVWCWGEGTDGQIGAGVVESARFPLPVPGMLDPISIAAGGGHTCVALKAGDVWCWGYNGEFQLGVDRSTSGFAPPMEFPDPGQVTVLPAPAIEVDAGDNFTCALLEDASVWCWGANDHGQLGRKMTSTGELPAVVPGVTGVAHLAITDDSACVLHTDGRVTCWGENGSGQLGMSDHSDLLDPTAIPGLTATMLTNGGDHTCAIVQGGHYTCWGHNDGNELGDGTSNQRDLPSVISLQDDYVALSAGFYHTCGIHTDGRVSCWGDNEEGSLGTGVRDASSIPVDVVDLDAVANVSAGNRGTCAIQRDRTIKCWGYGSYGLLGSGVAAEPTPIAVGIKADRVVAGERHSCAIVGGGVKCWGYNEFGQLGNGTMTDSTRPVDVTRSWGAVATPTTLGLGDRHSCAQLTNGEIWCWGANEYHQLGNGTTDRALVPVKVSLGSASAELGVSALGGCSLDATRHVYCWGNNDEGEIGDGSTIEASVPKAVMTTGADLSNVDDLVTGHSHACARVNTDVYCWGDNEYGQLGDSGLPTDSKIAKAVPISNANDLWGGRFAVCTQDTSAKVFCWGRQPDLFLHGGADEIEGFPFTSSETGPFVIGDDDACTVTGTCWGRSFIGQSGTGSLNYSVSPAPLAGVPGPTTAVSIGYEHGCAAAANKDVYCWGENADGQLGIGVASLSRVPVFVVFK